MPVERLTGESNSREPDRQNGRAPWWPTAVILGLFAAAAIPLILTGGVPGRAGWDHYNFHEPMIRRVAREWPWPDVSNYLSATTPLYHWLLAAVARYISDSTAVLQIVAAGFTVALLALLVRAVTAALPDRPALALVLVAPFAASLYVFPSGVWLLPDNAGWLGVLAVWLVALRPNWAWRHMLLAAGILLLLVLTRQIHIWAAALVWAAAWLGACEHPDDPAGPILPVAWLLHPRADRLCGAALAGVLTLPAFAIVAGFVAVWGGLTVPRFQGLYAGLGPATPAFLLSLLAVYSAFYAGWLLPGVGESMRRHGAALIAAAAVGLVLAVIPETTYSVEAGRFGGLWNLTRKVPAIAERSPVLLVGAPLGAATLVLWLAVLSVRDRVIMLTALVAFGAAHSASPQTWQRYQEPMLLMLIVLAAARSRTASRSAVPSRWGRAAVVAGPVALAIIFAAQNAAAVARGKDARTVPREPLTSPHFRGPPMTPPAEYTEEPLNDPTPP